MNGRRLVELRKSRGLTQEQLAAHADCDVKTIRAAEHSHRVDLQTASSLAATLGVPLGEVVLPSATTPADEEAHLQAVRRQVAAINARDPDAFAATFTVDGVNHVNAHPDLPGAGVQRGRDEIREGARIAFETYVSEPITPEMVEFRVVGDKVYLRVDRPRLRGVVTQIEREVSTLMEFTIRDGLISELRSHFHSGMLEELVFGPHNGNGSERRRQDGT